MCIFFYYVFTENLKTISISEAIGITLSFTFIISLTIGFGLGILATHCHKRNRFSTESNNEEQLERQFYEEVYPLTSTVTVEVPVAENVAYSTANPPTTSTVQVPVANNVACATVNPPTASTVEVPVAKNIAYATVNH